MEHHRLRCESDSTVSNDGRRIFFSWAGIHGRQLAMHCKSTKATLHGQSLYCTVPFMFYGHEKGIGTRAEHDTNDGSWHTSVWNVAAFNANYCVYRCVTQV